jgi:intein/homing endonuclease
VALKTKVKAKQLAIKSKTVATHNIKYTAAVNCLSCRKFITCTKSRKAFNYVCDSFQNHSKTLNMEAFDIDVSDEPLPKKKKLGVKAKTEPVKTKAHSKKKYKVDNTDDDANGFNVERLVQEVEAEHATGIIRDLKIDDRDLKEAPNAFEFATSENYVGFKPYPKQMEILLNYYQDYCVQKRCTDLRYIKNVPTDAWVQESKNPEVIYGDILDHVTLLVNGKCPKCGSTRADGWAKGVYNPYTELAGLAGQRCVAFDTYVLTEHGMLKIGELFDGIDYGFTNTELALDDGSGNIVTAEKLYKARPEPPIRITLSDGTRLTGTRDHPVLTSQGMIKLGEIDGSYLLPVYLDQECWGPNVLAFNELNDCLTDNCMPRALRGATRAANIEYLRLMFAAYGKLEDDPAVLRLILGHQVLAEEIKLVLQNLGIASYLTQEADRQFLVNIPGQAIIRAVLIINFALPEINDIALYAISEYHGYHEAPFYQTASRAIDIVRMGNPDYYVKVETIEQLQVPCVTYDFTIPDGHKFWANGIVSHNSGKSALMALMATHTLHRYMKLQNAPLVLGLAKNSTLHGVFIATTFAQAKDALFDPINDLIHDSKFFQDYHKMLDHYGRKHGEELYKFKETIISYKPRSLVIYPSVPNKRTLRGRTLFLGSEDEIGWFDTNKGTAIKLNADEIYIAMKRSFLTVRSAVRNLRRKGKYNIPEPLFGNISSPSSRFDKICRLVEEAKHSKTIYAYHFCLTGDMRIPTNKGLLRIDNMQRYIADGGLLVAGEHTPARATAWAYSGKKNIFKFTTASGHVLKVSPNHLIKVLVNGKHAWVAAKKVKENDLLCINPIQVTRDSVLRLPTLLNSVSGGTDSISMPEYMTPDLAFAIGALIAEGCFFIGSSRGYVTSIYNNNVEWLNKVKTCIDTVFGLNGTIRTHLVKGYTSECNGQKITNNHEVMRLYYGSKQLYSAWVMLGLSNIHTADKRSSWFKALPWSILKADSKSQLAFLAAYIEADGWVGSNRHTIGIASRSIKLLQKMQLLLASHGVLANVKGFSIITSSNKDAVSLYRLIKPYLTTKLNPLFDGPLTKIPHAHGFPLNRLREFFVSRKLPRKGSNVSKYLSDAGFPIEMRNSLGENINGNKYQGIKILRGTQVKCTYASCEAGLYDGLFADLKNVSETEYSNVQDIIKHGYVYTPVITIRKLKNKQKTYDISIESGSPPAFVANGIVVHNSTYQANPTITPEDLEDERRSDPEAYKRDYLAIPPRASSAFIPDIKIVRACIDPKRTNMFAIKQKAGVTTSGSEMTKAWVKFVRRDSQTPRFLAFDAGEKFNSFSLCLMSLNENGVPVMDGIGEIVPEPGKPLNFNNIYKKVICPIVETFNVKFVAADRWNSAQILSDLEDEYGIGQSYHRLTYDEMCAVRTAMTEAKVIWPKNEIKIKDSLSLAAKDYPSCFIGQPMSHFVVQALTVEEVMGKSVVKGEKKTDDMFRAFMLCYTKIMDPELQEMFLDDTVPVKRSSVVGAMGSMSSPQGSTTATPLLGAMASIGSGGGNQGGAKIFVGR